LAEDFIVNYFKEILTSATEITDLPLPIFPTSGLPDLPDLSNGESHSLAKAQ
jgi:hypothetical protein